jgi:hypothetical protein
MIVLFTVARLILVTTGVPRTRIRLFGGVPGMSRVGRSSG